MTDAELLETWSSRDRHAGEALFERHFRALYRFFRNEGVDAMDDLVAQQTCLGCVEGRDRLRDAGSFRTYLFASHTTSSMSTGSDVERFAT